MSKAAVSYISDPVVETNRTEESTECLQTGCPELTVPNNTFISQGKQVILLQTHAMASLLQIFRISFSFRFSPTFSDWLKCV